MTTSLDWWQVVIPLAQKLLEANPKQTNDPYVLLNASLRSIGDLLADGEVRRTRLTSLLPGRLSRLTSRSFGEGEVPNGYIFIAEHKKASGAKASHAIHLGEPGTRWRFFDAFSQDKQQAIAASGAPVIIDTYETDWPVAYAAIDGVPAASSTVVIMPHTAIVERTINEYLGWAAAGRPVREPKLPVLGEGLPHAVDPTAISGTFGITGFVAQGDWTDSSAVDSARKLLVSRFDLHIGFWDLVQNATLRDALLEVDRVALAPIQEVTLRPSREH